MHEAGQAATAVLRYWIVQGQSADNGRAGGIHRNGQTANGVGIPASEIPHLMHPFEQVGDARTRKHGGTGLGLALTKALVEQHCGRIELSSEVGKGTTVTMRLPLIGPPITQ